MDVSLKILLLLFAGIGFGGAGAACALARQRLTHEGEMDVGMLGVAALLLVFAVLCATVGTGVFGLAAYGGVVLWLSYLTTAQRIGLFRIETGILDGELEEAPPRMH